MRFILSSFYVVSLPPFRCFFVCRTGEAALGYGEVAEECLRGYWPKRAYVGRYGKNFTIYSPPPPPPPPPLPPPPPKRLKCHRIDYVTVSSNSHSTVRF